jgi:hypothetical protein
LQELVFKPSGASARWHKYLDVDKIPNDPWGRPYVYEFPGRHNPDGYDIYSLGPNGNGGDEAIGNWSPDEQVIHGMGPVGSIYAAPPVAAATPAQQLAGAAGRGGRRGGAGGGAGGGGGGGGGGRGGAAFAAAPANSVAMPMSQNAPAATTNGVIRYAQTAEIGQAVRQLGQPAGLLGAATTPTAAGLRSIHIEIPKHGQPFTFTKVLNTGGKPLDIQMSVMSARVFATMRSGFQVAAFLLGLLLIWWQRHTRNSFFITLGAALAIAAVAELLIAGRILDLALIVAAPVLALVVLIVVLRRIWPKRAAVLAEKQKAESGHEPEPPSPPIVPPVAASIALLLFLTHSAQAQDPAPWIDWQTNFALLHRRNRRKGRPVRRLPSPHLHRHQSIAAALWQ